MTASTLQNCVRRGLTGGSFVGLLFLSNACGPGRAPEAAPTAPQEKPSTLSELLPLKDKTVSSFEMLSDQGEEGQLMLEIFRPREDHAELTIAGRTQRLIIEDHRVSQLSGGILLEEPIEEGHSFVGAFGQTTITDTDVRIELPAGTFEHCVTTVEESTRPPKRATSTYCPHVGLAHLVVETFGEEGVRLETRLRHHGPRIDIRDERTLEEVP